MTFSAISILALTAFIAPFTSAVNVLYELTDAHATVYYDLTNSLCGDASKGDPFPANWAETSGINAGIPFCQGQTAKTLDQLGTNRIVAMNGNMVTGDPSKWCGKEVQIIQADGTPLVFDEGPLFIWDACAACSGSPIIDLSAKAFVQLKDGTCSGNNPGGLKVQVLDNNIWQPNSGGGGSNNPSPSPQPQPSPPVPEPSPSRSSSSSSSSPSPSSSTAKSSSVSKHTTTIDKNENRPTFQDNNNVVNTASSSRSRTTASQSVLVSEAVVQVPIPTGVTRNCQYGAWQCNGLSLEVCNYVELYKLDWERIAMCDSVCEITESGSVDCE